MKLFYSPGASSLAPHIVLRELQLTPELEEVDLSRKRSATGVDFVTINPKGYVPVLELDDGQRLTEAAVIVVFLADQHPHAALLPPVGDPARYRVLETLHYLAMEVHMRLGSLFDTSLPESWRDSAQSRLQQALALVDGQLGDRPFLFNQYTIADPYLFMLLNWTKPAGVDLGAWPRLLAFRKRVGSRPAVRTALEAEKLLPAERKIA